MYLAGRSHQCVRSFFDVSFLVSFYCRYCCSYSEASLSVLGQHGWARISALYGFITAIVVGLLQVVVLMNEAFPFDSMLCHGVHPFPHWMTR